MDKDRKKYLLDYAKKTYKRVPLDVKLDEYDLLKAEADRKGLPLNTFIKKACDLYAEKPIFFDSSDEDKG